MGNSERGPKCHHSQTPMGHGWAEQNQSRDHGHSRTRLDRQLELDRTHSKSRKRLKSCRQSKSRKRSKSDSGCMPRSGHSSCSGSPMSLGSLAVGSSLALALKVRTRPGTPSKFGGWEELPRGAIEEEEEEMDATENDDANQAKD